MERRNLEYPTDYPLFSGMDEHGPQDEYAEFLVSAINDDTETLLEAVEGLADGEDVEMLLQIQQRLESLVQEVNALRAQA
jgi:hypothetical protein